MCKSIISVYDLLQILVKGDNYYIYSSNKTRYNRIGNKVVDGGKYFESNDEDIYSPFTGLVFNKEKLNLSIRLVIDGKVRLDSERAKSVDLNEEIETKVYRNHCILKNGELNMDEIEVLLDNDTLDNLKDRVDVIELVEYNDKVYNKAKINLNNFGIVDKDNLFNYSNMEDILKVVENKRELKIKEKVLKYYLKGIEESEGIENTFMEGKYNEEQINVLKEYGLDKNGVYVGVDKEVVKKVVDEGIIVEFQIKGKASIPSVNSVVTKLKAGKKLSKVDTEILEYFNNCKLYENDKDVLKCMLCDTSKLLNLIDLRIFCIKLNKIVLKEWYKDDRIGNIEKFLYEGKVDTLVIKYRGICVQ